MLDLEKSHNIMDISSDLLDEISSDAHSSDLSGHSNQSTGSTTSSPRKATFFFDENSSQDSGVGFDRDSRDAKEDLVSDKVLYEPPRGKTNNVVSDQVRHKPTCAVTEKS